MILSTLKAQIRGEVSAALENLRDHLPKPVTSVITSALKSADRSGGFCELENLRGYLPKTSYLGGPIPPLKRRSEWRFRKLQKPRDRSRKPTSAPDPSVMDFIDLASAHPAFKIYELNATPAARRKSLIWNLDRRKNRVSAQSHRA